jgi:Sulfotransferase family
VDAYVGAEMAIETAKVRGFVGPVQKFRVHGWAFDPGAPDEHLMIEVQVDGKSIGTVKASLFYDHLAKAGIGTGDHGFVFNASQEIPVETPQRVRVIARSQSGGVANLVFGAGPASAASSPAAAVQVSVRPSLEFTAASTDPAQHPVFIFGSARSGTSAMAQALKRHTRYVGHGEGHLLDLLRTLLNAVSAHYAGRYGEWASGTDTMIGAVPQEFMLNMIRHGFVELARNLFPKGYWLDKTPRPDMTRAAPLLLEIWPDARFIYMKRRGFENVESRRRKFPTMDFESHCAGWTDSIVAWEAVRGGLAGRAIEVDQVFLSREPALAAEALTTFLLLTEVERRRLEQTFAVDQPERTSASFAQVYKLQDLPWSTDQKELFHQICGDAMRRSGYSETDGYFLADRAANNLNVL